MWQWFFPTQASTYAEKVDIFFYSLSAFVALFTIGILAVLLFLGTKYMKRPGENRRSEHVENLPLELTWTAIPFVISIGIFFWGATLYFDYAEIPENTLDIDVMGKQWMWKVRHPNGMRETNALTIPVGQPIKLNMTSQDVIHNFYVPAFRVKQDVLPARYTTLTFTPTKTGTFPLFCAEYCGTEHSYMGGNVTVMELAEYEEWVSGGPALTPASAGQNLFNNLGCATCHMAGDASRGPSLENIMGTSVALTSGDSALIDEEYLRRSILNPSADVVEGYAPIMPSYAGQLSDDDVLNLIAYIKSLSQTS